MMDYALNIDDLCIKKTPGHGRHSARGPIDRRGARRGALDRRDRGGVGVGYVSKLMLSAVYIHSHAGAW